MKGGGFHWALVRMKDGVKVYRAGWFSKGKWLVIREPDFDLPHIALRNTDAQLVPWSPTHADLLAEDWHDLSPEVP